MSSPSTLYRARRAAGQSLPVGAPLKLTDAIPVTVTLDAESLAIADSAGPRTRSATVRAALIAWHSKK